MLVLNHSEVRELLPMRECMDAVGEALSALSRGEGVQPLRDGFVLPDRSGVLAWMPGSLAAGRPFGVKVLSVVDNPGELGVDSHQGGVMIFDPSNGAPLVAARPGAITAVRTAAALGFGHRPAGEVGRREPRDSRRRNAGTIAYLRRCSRCCGRSSG